MLMRDIGGKRKIVSSTEVGLFNSIKMLQI